MRKTFAALVVLALLCIARPAHAQNFCNVTATFGTGTTALDVTHTAAVVTGTQLRVQFTTQAAETLAGVVCTLSIT